MDHGYTDEQKASTTAWSTSSPNSPPAATANKSLVMDYYDGNTVTGLWNLAQHFALNDNSFDTQFGPSTPGALNLISGETHGAEPATLGRRGRKRHRHRRPEPDLDDCGDRQA